MEEYRAFGPQEVAEAATAAVASLAKSTTDDQAEAGAETPACMSRAERLELLLHSKDMRAWAGISKVAFRSSYRGAEESSNESDGANVSDRRASKLKEKTKGRKSMDSLW